MKKNTILIAYKSEMDFILLNSQLSQSYQIVPVKNEKIGLKYVKRHKDELLLIISDMEYAKKSNNFHFLSKCKKETKDNPVPFIFMSSGISDTLKHGGKKAGADSYIIRPFTASYVSETIKEITKTLYPSTRKNKSKPKPKPLEQKKKKNNKLQQMPTAVEPQTALINNSLSVVEQAENVSRRWMKKITKVFQINDFATTIPFQFIQFSTIMVGTAYLDKHPESKLTKSDIHLMGLASTFCDIGKLVHTGPSYKKKNLTPEETLAIYKRHPEAGRDIFSDLPKSLEPFSTYLQEICLCHHEKYDGKGFPNGLKKDEIPISAQIVSAGMIIIQCAIRCADSPDFTKAMKDQLKKMAGSQFSFDMLLVLYSRIMDFKSIEEILKKNYPDLKVYPYINASKLPLSTAVF